MTSAERPQPAHRFARRGGASLGAAAEDEQQAEEQHRQPQVGGDELVLEALLDGEPAERRLGEDQDAGGDRAPDQQPVRAQPPKGAARRRRAISTVTTVAAMRWVNSTTDSAESAGRTPPSHSGQPWVPLPAGAAAEARVADADDPADQDQREGGGDREGDEAAEAGQLIRIATSGDCTHRLQATGALSAVVGVRPRSRRRLRLGSGSARRPARVDPARARSAA